MGVRTQKEASPELLGCGANIRDAAMVWKLSGEWSRAP